MSATLKSLRGLTLFFCVLGSGGGSFLWSDVESQLPDFSGASLPDIACPWSFHLDLYRIGYSECGESFWSSDSLVVCSSGRAVLLPPPPPGDDGGQTACLILRASNLTPRRSTLLLPMEHAPPLDGARSVELPTVRRRPAGLSFDATVETSVICHGGRACLS